jgi:hypothetical protein
MTHEELLNRMNWASERYHDTDGRAQYFNALRAVVELHKPEEQDHKQYEKCWNCNLVYPCPTIYAIERELK